MSDAHFSFFRRLGPPDHLFNHSSTTSTSTSTGLRFYLSPAEAQTQFSTSNSNSEGLDPFPPSTLDRDRPNQPPTTLDDQVDPHTEFNGDQQEVEVGLRLGERECEY